ncbi:cell division protein Cdc14 [Gautieria morchelliformis]|nr:cell division protein Cdc14 [Gautieria morchelliformis]
MRRTLADALDDLSSSRSSLTRRNKALDTIEHVLARLCVPTCETLELDAFLKLQDGFEYNIACRLIQCISTLLPSLQHGTNTENNMDPDISSTSRIITQSLSILQGVALLHPSSKSFLSKKWCIQIFADLLTISRLISPAPLSGSTNTVSNPSTANSEPTLASSTIDTLLCILVDAPAALRAFEEVGGVEVVVKILKKTGVAKNIRIKCIEFLYFYLLDETGEVTLTPKPKSLSTPQKKSRTATPLPSSLDASTSAPSSRSVSADSAAPRTPRKAHANFALLRKDLDFIPMTPKKVTRFGVGTPRTPHSRTPHSVRSGRTSPIDISDPPASPKRRRIIESSQSFLHSEGRRRSTQEKKEILGSLLGNVDTLIEGVAKSGIWGLG